MYPAVYTDDIASHLLFLSIDIHSLFWQLRCFFQYCDWHSEHTLANLHGPSFIDRHGNFELQLRKFCHCSGVCVRLLVDFRKPERTLLF